MSRRSRTLLSLAFTAASIAVSLAAFLTGEDNPMQPRPWLLRLPVLAGLIYAAVMIPAIALAWRRTASDDTADADAFAGVGPEPWKFALAGLCIAGVSLRLANLWNYHYCNDEILFVTAAGHASLADTLRDCLRHFHPPTNFVMIHFLLKFSWDPLWVRLPAVIGGTLAIPLTFLFVRRLFGLVPGLFAAFLVTFSPNLILLSQVCRNYSPSLPFYLASLYFLARYLGDSRLRFIFGFAIFEILSIAWHYAYLPVFLATNVVLFLYLLRTRQALRHWAATLFSQAPVGLIYFLAIFYHLPLAHADTQFKILEYMDDEYRMNWGNPAGPVLSLFRYLLADDSGIAHFLLSASFLAATLLGVHAAWRNRQRWQAGLCLAFLPFAWFFAFGIHLLPFGGTRHSFYVFPFAFALFSRGLFRILSPPQRGDDPSVPSIANAALHPASGSPALRAGLLAVFGGLFLFASMRQYSEVLPYYLRPSPAYYEHTPYYRPSFYRIAELPTRSRDLEQIAQLLLAQSEPGESVICSYPTFMILNAYLGRPPIEIFFDLHSPSEFVWQDRRFLFLPEAHYGFTPDSLLVTVAAAARGGALGGAPRVWVALAGWETWPIALYDWTEIAYPELGVDIDPWEDRTGLFAVQTAPAVIQSGGVLEFDGAGPPRP